MNILVSKRSSSMTRLRVSIPASLAADLDAVQREAEGHGLTLDVSSICADALARAVRQARAELSRIRGQQSGQPDGQQADHGAA